MTHSEVLSFESDRYVLDTGNTSVSLFHYSRYYFEDFVDPTNVSFLILKKKFYVNVLF